MKIEWMENNKESPPILFSNR